MPQQRDIKVNKQNLIAKIKENKEIHLKEYAQAIIDYKDEAEKQLKKLKKDLADGKMNLHLELTTPVDCSKEYDKLIEAFEWEIEEQVTLSQQEFNQCVRDEHYFAVSAKMSNMAYSKGF